jgi:hypothetical protein
MASEGVTATIKIGDHHAIGGETRRWRGEKPTPRPTRHDLARIPEGTPNIPIDPTNKLGAVPPKPRMWIL